MGPWGSVPHSQGLSNNLYSEPLSTHFLVSISTYIRYMPILFSHLRLGFSKGPFPVGLPVTILKAPLTSLILTTWCTRLNLPDVISLVILGERYKLKILIVVIDHSRHILYILDSQKSVITPSILSNDERKRTFLKLREDDINLCNFEMKLQGSDSIYQSSEEKKSG